MFARLKIYQTIIVYLVFVSHVSMIFSDISQANKSQSNIPFARVHVIEPGEWLTGIFDDASSEEYFFFEAQKGVEYLIPASVNQNP